MGTDRTADPTAEPLPGHFRLLPGLKGQDGALQRKRSPPGEPDCLVSCGSRRVKPAVEDVEMRGVSRKGRQPEV